MIKIYFNEIAIYFTDKKDVGITKNIKITVRGDINKVVKKLQNNKYENDINLYGYDVSSMFKDFCGLYSYIEAAGGVVNNEHFEYLLIKRFGIWDLPKGKVEKGETVLKAAVREVCEETGLQQVVIINNLPDTYHIYEQKGRWFLKKTYWYSMETQENITLIPQTNEAITDAVWMKKLDAHNALSKSYRSLFDTLGYLII